MQKKIFNIILIALLVLANNLEAQNTNLNKVVEVVKPYQPSVSDASKINLLPAMNDSVIVNPVFDYKIIASKRIDSNYEPKAISAAKMMGLPLTKLYKTYIKLGIANYLTPLAEIHFNTLRSKDLNVGGYFKHLSSHADMKLEQNRTTYGGFADNALGIFGKKMYKNSLASGNIDYAHNTFYYYGFNTILDTSLNKKDIKQNFNNLNARINYQTTYTDSSHLNYSLSGQYHFFGDASDTHENEISLFSNFNGVYKKQDLSAAFDLRYFNSSATFDTSSLTVVRLNPAWSQASKEWTLKLGVNAYLASGNDETKFYVYPEALFHFVIMEQIAVPYLGIDGHLDVNNFSELTAKNQWVMPGMPARNTGNLRVFGGLSGSLNAGISYNAGVSYTLSKDMLLFMNDSSNVLGNKFLPLYDNAEIMKYFGEIGWQDADRINLRGRFAIYSYKLDQEAKAWHMPQWEASVLASYNLRDKIVATAEAFAIGKRYARPANQSAKAIELEGVFDLNLGCEYRYTKILSFFARINNLASARYQMWNQYPTQGITVMAGFTYSLGNE